MDDLTKKAEKYAAEKMNEFLAKAFAYIYADGYRQGYKDREEKIPIDLHGEQIEFIDLGLPSGTLWSNNYVMGDNNDILYIPYDDTKYYNIPTTEQWNELFITCKLEYTIHNFILDHVYCTGPNGNVLRFNATGKKEAVQIVNNHEGFFWLKEEKEGYMKRSVRFFNQGWYFKPQTIHGSVAIIDEFSGFKLPVRLVKSK